MAPTRRIHQDEMAEEAPVEEALSEATYAEPQEEEAPVANGRIIKYMGLSDFRVLNPGETLLGAHAHAPLETGVRWTPNDSHVINTSDFPDVPDTFWDELVKLDDFQDVTDEFNDSDKKVPLNDYERTWKGMTD